MTAYEPRFQSQLGRGPTDTTDCGVRSTQMAIDWATNGARRPRPEELRTRMGVTDGGTSPADWVEAIESYDTAEELDGKFEHLSASDVTDSPTAWQRVASHIAAGRGAVLAVDYRIYRRLMPAKAGSATFNGNHAIFFLGCRKRATGTQFLAWDPLNDGRRAGIPSGPVWVDSAKVRAACERVNQKGTVYGVLVWRGAPVETKPEVPTPEPEPTLWSVYADMCELLHAMKGTDDEDRMQELVDDMTKVLGFPGPFALAQANDEPDDSPDGVRV